MTRSFRRSRRAAAGAGVVAGGAIVTTFQLDLDLLDFDFDASDLLSLALIALFSVVAIRRLRQYEERTKADVRLLAEQHLQRTEMLDCRERALATRERKLQLCENTHALRMRSLVYNLDTARAQLAAKTTEHELLQKSYDEVRGDHNALIEQILRQGYDRFTARTEGAYKPFSANTPHRGDEHQRGETPVPVTLLRPREHHPSA